MIDTSGEGLHKRGYRRKSNDAPLKETLAAAICDTARIFPDTKMFDPFCGSGTILIEAAMMALKMAPGLRRFFAAEKFGFNGNFNVGEITCNGGYYDAKGANITDLGWSGVGQHTVLSSPITLMKLSGTIANNGNEIAPRLIKSIKNSIGLPTTINISLPTNKIDSEHAKKLNLMLEQAAKYSFGNELANKYSLRAKTGTAEVEKGAPHSWVTGFLANNKTPYAFAIIIENGGGAASSTRYILNVLLKGLTEIK